MRQPLIVSGLFLLAYAISGQAAAAPAFEVASVKVSQIGKAGGEGSRRQRISTEPGSLTMRNVSMLSAISWAYSVLDFQVSGPAWLGSERYDIVAKASNAAPDEQLRLMLQTLLADRFQFAAHREQKVMPKYILTVAKGGPKFHESTTEGEPEMHPGPNRTSAVAQRVTVARFIDMLERILRAPVIDETGLKGRYDASIDLTQYAGTPIQMDDINGTVISAVQDLLGLKLEPKKGPVDMVIVDRVEKVPTEN